MFVLICLKQVFLDTTQFGGHKKYLWEHCTRMLTHGYGPPTNRPASPSFDLINVIMLHVLPITLNVSTASFIAETMW